MHGHHTHHFSGLENHEDTEKCLAMTTNTEEQAMLTKVFLNGNRLL